MADGCLSKVGVLEKRAVVGKMQMLQFEKEVNTDQHSIPETLGGLLRNGGITIMMAKGKRHLSPSINGEDILAPPDKRMKVENSMTGNGGRSIARSRSKMRPTREHMYRDEDNIERSDARKILSANFKMLIEEIDPFHVAKHLKGKGIVDEKFYQTFRQLRTRREKVKSLLIKVDLLLLEGKDLHAFNAFKEALNENEDNIVNALQKLQNCPEVRCTTMEQVQLCKYFEKAKDKIIATMEPRQLIDDLVSVHAIDLQQYDIITKKESRIERATELYNIAVQNFKIIKQLFEFNKELSSEYKKECGSTHTLSCNPEATSVALRYSLSENFPVKDTQEHSDVKSKIKKIEKDIVDSANDNSVLEEDILKLTASVLESVKLGSIIFRLRTSGDMSIKHLKECCKNGTAVDWLMSVLKPGDIKKLQELNTNGGVIECYIDDNDCKKQIFDEVFQECCCAFSKNFIQSHLAEFEAYLRGSELDVIDAMLMSDTLDEKLAMTLSEIKACATNKDLIQKLIEFLLHSELQQINFCVIEKEILKKKEINQFRQQQQPFKKCLGEVVDDEVTIVKENIKRSVDLLEEELDARWFIEILELRGDEACMKILTAIKRSQSRKCRTKLFVRFLCEVEDIGWFIEALYEYSPHVHAILTQSKNPGIERDTRRAMLSVYDFILDELEPLELKSCLSNSILEQLNFLQMEKSEQRFDRATFFMQQILKNENLEIIQDVMVAMASKYFNIERVIKDVLTKGSFSQHYLCPRVEKHNLGMLKTIYKAHFKLPIPNVAVIHPIKTMAEVKQMPTIDTAESLPVKEEMITEQKKEEEPSFEHLSAEEAKIKADWAVNMGDAGNGRGFETCEDGNPNLPEISYKNPTMLLNEKRKGLKFELLSDTRVGPNKVWRYSVELEGQKFDGTGRSKKLAKQKAAKYALKKIFNILCVSGPFKCEVCFEKFGTKRLMQQHKAKSHLISHRKKHTGVDKRCPVPFPTCGYSTRRLSPMIQHVNSHICQVCGESFAFKGKLLRHQRIHFKEKCKQYGYQTLRTNLMKQLHIEGHGIKLN